MKFILIFFILVACGRRVVEESSFPENRASAVEAEVLDKALTKIQADLDALGVNVNVFDTSYSVASIDPAAGICFTKANGSRRGIALDHSLFEETIESDDWYGQLYKVLLHEIGHCYFDRDHDEGRYDYQGHVMLIELTPNHIDRSESISQSLMSELGWMQVPKLLWPYYVKEIAGLDRINSWEDIRPYTSISVEPVSTIETEALKR